MARLRANKYAQPENELRFPGVSFILLVLDLRAQAN
jgi:hypothetical protein